MKSYDVVGYTADAETYCGDCCTRKYGSTKEGTFDNEGNEIGAIFADSEWDCSLPCCTICGETLEGPSVIHYPKDGVCSVCDTICDA